MVIYWDVLLAVNFVLNGLILYLTAIAMGQRITQLRIIVAALIGAIYVVASGVSDLLTLVPVKWMLSLVLVAVTFGYRSWRTFLFCVAVFYLVSFVIGGAVLGWMSWWNEQALSHRFLTMSEVGGGALVGAVVLLWALRRVIVQTGRRTQLVRVTVVCGGRTDAFDGLIDSGNTLSTAIRRTPVIIAEHTAVPTICGQARSYLATHEEEEWIRGAIELDELWRTRGMLLPYRSVAGSGMLVGIRADEVIIETDGRRYRTCEAVIAVTKRRLATDGAYRAIVPSRLLEDSFEEGEVRWGA